MRFCPFENIGFFHIWKKIFDNNWHAFSIYRGNSGQHLVKVVGGGVSDGVGSSADTVAALADMGVEDPDQLGEVTIRFMPGNQSLVLKNWSKLL